MEIKNCTFLSPFSFKIFILLFFKESPEGATREDDTAEVSPCEVDGILQFLISMTQA